MSNISSGTVWNNPASEPVEIRLVSDDGVGLRVIAFFSPHIENKPDSQEVEVSNTDPYLHAPEQK